jgi:thiol-disulfide isomerase/thioredoxin
MTRGALWIAVALVAVWIYFGHMGRVRLVPPSAAAPAEGLSMVDLHGSRVDLERFRGNVVLVNLWASWCPPCRREIPDLAGLHDRYEGHGLVVLGVNVEDADDGHIRQVSEDLRIPYDVVRPVGPLSGSFVTRGTIPHTWLIDREGRVRASHSGYASAGSLDAACRELLDEG